MIICFHSKICVNCFQSVLSCAWFRVLELHVADAFAQMRFVYDYDDGFLEKFNVDLLGEVTKSPWELYA